jgi:hypothetical protein
MQYMDQVDAQGEALVRVSLEDLKVIANALARYERADARLLVPLVEDVIGQIQQDMGQ